MPGREGSPMVVPTVRGRCRCGHLPTHHMIVAATQGSFRLDPSGPCAICGEAGCRKYVAGGR